LSNSNSNKNKELSFDITTCIFYMTSTTMYRYPVNTVSYTVEIITSNMYYMYMYIVYKSEHVHVHVL